MYETIITQQQLTSLLEDPEADIVVVDCRFSLGDTAWGGKQYVLGHVRGAHYAHLDRDLSGPVEAGTTGRHPLPDAEQFAKWVRDHGIKETTQVIVYDQGGGAIAARLWWLLRWIGHTGVAVLDGGWQNWVRAGLPTDQSVPALRSVSRDLQPDATLVMTADEVSARCGDERYAVVDAREERRFTGEEENIDPIAGHIPGASNLPYGDNTDAQGFWKSPNQLRKRFEHLLQDRSAEDIAFYCGSGVTACHNVLAFRHAGLGDALLYAGSWSEWITKPERGVEVSD